MLPMIVVAGYVAMILIGAAVQLVKVLRQRSREKKGTDPTLKYKWFRATVEYNAKYDVLVGTVLGTDGYLKFHGTSVTELKEKFKQCIDNYLESREK